MPRVRAQSIDRHARTCIGKSRGHGDAGNPATDAHRITCPAGAKRAVQAARRHGQALEIVIPAKRATRDDHRVGFWGAVLCSHDNSEDSGQSRVT